MSTFIYALCEPHSLNAVRYVGKANKPSNRYKSHKREKRTTRKCRWLASVLRRDAEPIVRILEEVDESDWQRAERKWIAHFRAAGCDLTNHTDGGEGLSGACEETRAKLSVIAKARMADPVFRAKLFTPERAAKLSKSLTGLSKSAAHVAKLPQCQKGFRHRPEFGAKIAAAMRGNKHALGFVHTEETKRRISMANAGNKSRTGQTQSRDEKLKKSQRTQGVCKTDLHRQKISEAAKRRWASEKAVGIKRRQSKPIQWPSWELIQEQLRTRTTKELAAELGVKPGSLSGYILRRRRGVKINFRSI